jgi:sodium-dependent dicarboxylate transporter 2/3/5
MAVIKSEAKFYELVSIKYFTILIFAVAISIGIWDVSTTLSVEGRWTLIIFALAMVGWIMTPIDDTAVSLAAALALVFTGAALESQFYASLGNEFVWLLISAFMLAEVLKQSKITELIAQSVLRNAKSFRGLFYKLTLFITATAVVVPSTSARAAMLVPIYAGFVATTNSPNLIKAYSLLFPSVILLSAGGFLTGAGAHLIALELLTSVAPQAEQIGYARWLLLCLPIALASCFAATEIILRLYVDREDVFQNDKETVPSIGQLNRQQVFIISIAAFTVILWATSNIHNIGLATIGVAAALIVSLKSYSGVDLKTALRGVEWSLIVFFAAAIFLGQTMLTTGAGRWLADGAIAALPLFFWESDILIVAVICFIALWSHLLIISRSARAAILIPALALPLAAKGYSPTTFVLLTVIATGFCQTLPVSAKPVTLFHSVSESSYSQQDLLRLAAALFPIMMILLLVAALYVWPMLGLQLKS